MNRTPIQHCHGVTLIELLVGVATGAIVILAVIAAWGLSVRTAAYALESARLNHDLRATMQILSQDLRRADGGVGVPAERAVRFSDDGRCITYFVERMARGFRWDDGGRFQMYFNDDPAAVPTCDEGGPNWVAIYQNLAPGEFAITDFATNWRAVCYPFLSGTTGQEFNSEAQGRASYPRCEGMTDVTEVLEVTLRLTGRIDTASGVKSMTLADTVTIRNNAVR